MTPRERVEEAGGIELSVVIPVFNEEETAGALVEQLDAVLSGEPVPYEMVLVDDGSRDATPRILGGRVSRVLALLGIALRCGARLAGRGAALSVVR